MSVVNCRVKYIREQGYNNLKEWINDSNNVYIGRGRIVFIDGNRYPPYDSPFANPFKNIDREKSIMLYRNYITERLEKEPQLVNELKKLVGKNLGCWCHPEPCHGDVIVELLNKYLMS